MRPADDRTTRNPSRGRAPSLAAVACPWSARRAGAKRLLSLRKSALRETAELSMGLAKTPWRSVSPLRPLQARSDPGDASRRCKPETALPPLGTSSSGPEGERVRCPPPRRPLAWVGERNLRDQGFSQRRTPATAGRFADERVSGNAGPHGRSRQALAATTHAARAAPAAPRRVRVLPDHGCSTAGNAFASLAQAVRFCLTPVTVWAAMGSAMLRPLTQASSRRTAACGATRSKASSLEKRRRPPFKPSPRCSPTRGWRCWSGVPKGRGYPARRANRAPSFALASRRPPPKSSERRCGR